MTKQKDEAAVNRVFAARAARLGTVPPPIHGNVTGPGAIWNTSGLKGYPGNQPMNVWAQSGLPYSPYNGTDPQDWRTVVVNAEKKHKEQSRG